MTMIHLWIEIHQVHTKRIAMNQKSKNKANFLNRTFITDRTNKEKTLGNQQEWAIISLKLQNKRVEIETNGYVIRTNIKIGLRIGINISNLMFTLYLFGVYEVISHWWINHSWFLELFFSAVSVLWYCKTLFRKHPFSRCLRRRNWQIPECNWW